MFFRKEKIWEHFHHDILASYEEDATMLYVFLKMQQINRTDIESFEVIDVQRYRLIKKKHKVAEILKRHSSEMCFIFPVNKN